MNREKAMTELAFISKDVRVYMEQNHLEFSDFEKASLIYHSSLSVEQKMVLLERLAETTEDMSLLVQLAKRLGSDGDDLLAFQKNTEGYIYATEVCDEEDNEPYICGYFATVELACAYGMRQGRGFTIKKYRIVSFRDAETKEKQGWFDLYQIRAKDVEEYITDCDDCGEYVATAQYDKDGTLQHFWSDEVERSDEDNIAKMRDLARFEYAFIRVPNPFESGDIVRFTGDRNRHGVVATSQTGWKEFLE